MNLRFESFAENACCLCGSDAPATGEHKIKASAIRDVFGSASMVISRFNDPSTPPKPAQGPKAKAFHFNARVCRECNNSATQAADLEFDRFTKIAQALLADGKDPSLAFSESRYSKKSENYLNVFRYFSKLLCCHLAEIKAPRSIDLTDFARGKTNQNPIWLAVDQDLDYARIHSEIGDHSYAAHGGLVISANNNDGTPVAFRSTLTIGPLRYVFYTELNELGQLDLVLNQTDFWNWCVQMAKSNSESPMSEDEELRLGIIALPKATQMDS